MAHLWGFVMGSWSVMLLVTLLVLEKEFELGFLLVFARELSTEFV